MGRNGNFLFNADACDKLIDLLLLMSIVFLVINLMLVSNHGASKLAGI
jgi:hypothetical protein